MEPKKLSELIPANLQHLQPASSELLGEVSIYKGTLTERCIVESVATIKKAFPALPLSFYDVFMDMLEGFTDDRLRDAVRNVISTCVYPQPTIAQFISFDKRIKVYTYSQYCKLCDEGTGKNYHPVAIGENTHPVWVHENDINQYNLKLWQT